MRRLTRKRLGQNFFHVFGFVDPTRAKEDFGSESQDAQHLQIDDPGYVIGPKVLWIKQQPAFVDLLISVDRNKKTPPFSAWFIERADLHRPFLTRFLLVLRTKY